VARHPVNAAQKIGCAETRGIQSDARHNMQATLLCNAIASGLHAHFWTVIASLYNIIVIYQKSHYYNNQSDFGGTQ
jgi:hypothetical protein